MKQGFKILLVILLGLFLFACSKITQENFDKIHIGMKKEEVVAILGEPTNTEDINIAGISGSSAQWKTYEAEIDLQFLNGVVTVKSFSKVGDKSDKK
ncbi:MAG: hypothetical protein A3F12_02115 [Gammaproteobacteria bacterium RIFCSPHIGHO2_12_FULL_38_14]|nr:MAG: hypothetical protein A3F12_02115 [Gammaproteobacteria bacterium RIFCSPHIGHO2_12_FULL_38_14]